MAIALSAPWSSLKSKLVAAEDRLQSEQARCKDRGRKIEALKNRVVKLQTQLEQLSPTPEPSPNDLTEFDLSEGDEV
jgi:chromosome segregation ATPase